MSYRAIVLCSTLFLLGTAAVEAQVEITPFVGYRFSGDVEQDVVVTELSDVHIEDSESYGVLVDFPVNRHVQLELLYSQQNTALTATIFGFPDSFATDIEYLHIGGLYQWAPAAGRIQPYVVAGLGTTRISQQFNDAEDRFSVSLGAGAKVPLGEHIGLRLESRYYATPIDEDNPIFCDYCFEFDDYVYSQIDLKAGLIFTF